MFNVFVLESIDITEQMMMREQTFVHYTTPSMLLILIRCSTVVVQCYRPRWQAIPMEQGKIRQSIILYPFDRSLPNLVWLRPWPTQMPVWVEFGWLDNSPPTDEIYTVPSNCCLSTSSGGCGCVGTDSASAVNNNLSNVLITTSRSAIAERPRCGGGELWQNISAKIVHLISLYPTALTSTNHHCTVLCHPTCT